MGRLLALEDASDIIAGLTERIGNVGTITHQPAGHGLLAIWKARGNRMAHRQFRDLLAPVVKAYIAADEKCSCTLEIGERFIDLIIGAGLNQNELQPKRA